MAEHFHALRIAEIVPETDEANSILFEVPDELKAAFRFKAGQHLTLRADIGGEEVRRNYSLCVAPDAGEIRVTVKRIAGGVFSNWVGDQPRKGKATVHVEVPTTTTWGRLPSGMLQITTHGAMDDGQVLTKELPLQLMAQKVRTMRVYEGPTEVHRMVIARRVMGLGR